MKKTILLISFMLSVFNSEANQQKLSEEVDLLFIYASTTNSTEFRSQSISADITGNTLTITFNENVGIAHIIIKDSNGVYIDRENVFSTPDYATFFIVDYNYNRIETDITAPQPIHHSLSATYGIGIVTDVPPIVN